jgi:hypothetical protein
MDAREYSYSLPALPSSRFPYFNTEGMSRVSNDVEIKSEIKSEEPIPADDFLKLDTLDIPSVLKSFGSWMSALETISPIALAEAVLVSQDLDLRYGKMLIVSNADIHDPNEDDGLQIKSAAEEDDVEIKSEISRAAAFHILIRKGCPGCRV